MKKSSKKIRRRCILICVALLLMSSLSTYSQKKTTPPDSFDFAGRLLVSVSDADMVASAYIDGELGPVAGTDKLSVIQLSRVATKPIATEIAVSNSVTGPPSCVAVTPDGQYAIVIETRKSRPIGKVHPVFKDLAAGKLMTVIDISDALHPKIVQQIEGPPLAKSVSINTEGSLVAVAFQPEDSAQSPLVIYHFKDGKLFDSSRLAIPGWIAGDLLQDAVFMPVDNRLALVNSTNSSLSFVTVTPEDRKLRAVKWGNDVAVDKEPVKVAFTPDGRYAVVNSMGENFVRGSVVSVQIAAAEKAAGGSPVHRLISRAETGVLPEGMAISPDGKWIVTTNLEHSYEPLQSPKQGFFSSLTLLRLDTTSGSLQHINEYPFDGILPEAAVFDNESKWIAVTTFDHYHPGKPGGSIDFWRITGDPVNTARTELVKTGYSVPVTRGAQSMVIVR